MKPEHYCRQKASPAGSSLYYSTLFHNPQQKRRLHALFALQQELTDTVAECQDAGVARIKLQWWREEIHRLFAAKARHPVSKALLSHLPELHLEQVDLLNLVETMENEINPIQKESMAQLIQHFTDSQGRVWQLAVLACGCQDAQAMELVVNIGGLNTCLAFLQLAQRQLHRGDCPYPLLEMEKQGLNHRNLLQTDRHAAIAELEKDLFMTLQSSLATCSRSLEEKKDPTTLFALSMARIAKATCAVLQKHSARAATRPLSITPLRKLWIAWRTRRQISSGGKAT